MIRRPPRATRTDTLFPYTTLFRSIAYLVALARATRESPSLSLGVSPRGTAMLLHAAKAWTWLIGRDFVTPDEVKAMAKPALRHRIALRPEVEREGGSPDAVLAGILATVPVHRCAPSPRGAWRSWPRGTRTGSRRARTTAQR